MPRRISGSSRGGQTPGKGDWYVTCDKIGAKFPASQTRQEWNGLRVWEGVFEERHPLDTPRSARPSAPPPFTRSTPPDITSSVIIPDEFVRTRYIVDAFGSFVIDENGNSVYIAA